MSSWEKKHLHRLSLAIAAAPEFSRYWIKAIKDHVFGPKGRGPHSFALAFKEALDNFRKADGGRFDHELFWAPYTLYGLG